jgi:multiple sugar transport system permease protein
MATSERQVLWIMASPFLVGLTVLVLLPAVGSLPMAAFRWDLIGSPSFVGLGNVRELFDDPIFRISLRNSLLFLVTAVPLRLVGAVALAALLRGAGRLPSAGWVAVVLPTLVPDAAYAVLWLWILNPLYGPLNLALGAIGAPTPSWLTQAGPARWGIVLMSLFQLGEGFLIALVARAQVPDELLELAQINGAGRWGRFVRVTIPLMAPALLVIVARDVIFALHTTFAPALLVTEGGPPPAATTYLPLFVYRNAFEYLRYGYASAAVVVMLLLSMSVLWLLYRAAIRMPAWRSR